MTSYHRPISTWCFLLAFTKIFEGKICTSSRNPQTLYFFRSKMPTTRRNFHFYSNNSLQHIPPLDFCILSMETGVCVKKSWKQTLVETTRSFYLTSCAVHDGQNDISNVADCGYHSIRVRFIAAGTRWWTTTTIPGRRPSQRRTRHWSRAIFFRLQRTLFIHFSEHSISSRLFIRT